MNKKWWKESIVYQIYPRSYKDTNNDGIGDLLGIIENLDYIKDLGVNVIWLGPIYNSPNDDNGYDISDYRNIMPEFGTMEQFDKLLDEMHKRDLKLVMDLVVNHSSDEHKWFERSKESRDNEYSEYYIWRDPKVGINGEKMPPNNWLSFFSGSAWEYCDKRDQYYLHLFSKKQPDLNWENEVVRKEVYDIMKFWLNKGIDGFRMDVINLISKVQGLPDGQGHDGLIGAENFFNGPRFHEFMDEMNKEVLSKYDCMTVGETPGADPVEALRTVGEDRKELNMLFQFEHMGIDSQPQGKWWSKEWTLQDLKENVRRWQYVFENGGWNSNYLMNHDQPRAVSRFGNDNKYRKESAKMLATFTMCLPGTPYVYQGEEIGMTNVNFNNMSEIKDIESINYYNEQINKGVSDEVLMTQIRRIGRDNSRTPMQWDKSDNAGFTNGIPWIKINENYTEINVEESQNDENSILNYYKKLTRLRRSNEALNYGEFSEVFDEDNQVFGFYRTYNNENILVLLNFSDRNTDINVVSEIDSLSNGNYEILLSNYNRTSVESKLEPYESYILKVM